jgi:hypothetical protein
MMESATQEEQYARAEPLVHGCMTSVSLLAKAASNDRTIVKESAAFVTIYLEFRYT